MALRLTVEGDIGAHRKAIKGLGPLKAEAGANATVAPVVGVEDRLA